VGKDRLRMIERERKYMHPINERQKEIGPREKKRGKEKR
jgi:hypothetical protein